MPKVGEAFYELTARDAGLFSALGKAEGSLAASGKIGERALGGGVTKGMAQAETAVAGGTARIGGMMGGAGGATAKLTSKIGDLKQGLVQGLGIGGFMAVSSAASEFIGKVTNSVGLASDLNETVSKSAATFGPAADAILKWSTTTSSTMGLAQQSALDYAATFGGLLQNFGLTAQAAAPMSQSLVKLAADMASFSNSTPEEALAALQSGLVGESEPLRRFQVNLSEARIQAKAMELGLWDGKGAIDASAKSQATYAIIMADTTRQQGDFAKTASGLANTQRTDAANSQEAWTRFGAALLPIANVIIPALANAGTGLVNFLTSLLSHGREVVPVLALVGGIVATVVAPAFIAWASATVVALAPFIAVAAAIGGVIFVLDKLGLLGPVIDAFWNGLKVGAEIIGGVFDAVFGVIRGVVSGIIGIVRNVIGIAAEIPGPWQSAAQGMKNSLSIMQADVEGWGKSTTGTVSDVGAAIPITLRDHLNDGAPTVAAAAQTGIVDPVKTALDTTKKEAVAKARELPGAIGDSIAAGRDAVASGADALKQAFKDHISPTKEIAQLEGDLTGKLMHRGLKSNDPIIRAAALQWQTDVKDRLFVLRNGVGAIALKTGQNVADALDQKKREIRAAALQHQQAIMHEYNLTKPLATTSGQKVGTAFADGLKDERGYLYDKVHDYLQSAYKQLKASSPPKEGPFSRIDKDAIRTADTYADAFASRAGHLQESVAGYLSKASLDLSAFSPTVKATVSPGDVGLAARSPVAAGARSFAIGDVHVPVTFAGGAPTDAASARALGRSLGEEIRLTLVRTTQSFPVGG